MHHSCLKILLVVFVAGSCFYSCSGPTGDSAKKPVVNQAEKQFYNGIGVGPITHVELTDPLNPEWIAQGGEIFMAKCVTCHEASDVRKIGPGLSGITKRRRPEWIMNQILNPMEMTQKDSLSKELLAIYMAQMTDMELTEKEARSVLEYLRSNDQ